MSAERARAVTIATQVLDRVSDDPDADIAVLARQFLRAIDATSALDAARLARAIHNYEHLDTEPSCDAPTHGRWIAAEYEAIK